MALNVLIVDDSTFFQSRLKNIINEHPDFNVIGVASNGREAIEKVKTLQPDIVTMDYEMPMMDGVTAVRAIMAENPLPILMLSSMTYEGARITLDALDAGAMDFMTKNFSEISANSSSIKKRIYDALLTISANSPKRKPLQVEPLPVKSSSSNVIPFHIEKPATNSVNTIPKISTPTISKSKPKLIVIGASTGGPAALTELLKTIPANFSIPIVIVQHMPETFTCAFAERLNRQCQIDVKEAETGDELKPGRALLAPGGKQLIIDSKNNRQVKVIDSSDAVNYKPCVDITFASVSNIYGADTLAIVLTGMGHDGRDGAKLLKAQGARVWTQSESSCLIYGMPMAIDKANLSDESLDIDAINKRLSAEKF
jgi:two-component system chemotaxis response regulator CheB